MQMCNFSVSLFSVSGYAGICGILGSTYTGEYEDIEKLDKLVEKLNKEKVCCTTRICSALHYCMDPLVGCNFLLDCSTSSCTRAACMRAVSCCASEGTQP